MKYGLIASFVSVGIMIFAGCGEKRVGHNGAPPKKVRAESTKNDLTDKYPYIERIFVVMNDSLVTFKVVLRDISEKDAEKAVAAGYRRMLEIQNKINVFDKKSEISRLNASGVRNPVKVSEDTFALLEASVKFSALTDGAFDITCGPILELWGFGINKERKIPPREKIEVALKRVGYKKLILDKKNLTASFAAEGMMVNLGGIGQGFMVDEAIKALQQHGVKHALVDVSGDIGCIGESARDKPWYIGIRHPRYKDFGEKEKLICGLYLPENYSLTTSGDYEKYYIIDGKRYAHTVNPKTGMPVPEEVVSATIVASDTTTCDGIDNAMFVLGHEKGMAIIEKTKDVEAIIITIDDKKHLKLHISSGLKKIVEIIPDE